ncbi:autotransporter outer membrane beta-barrel domain-containing protein [Vallitalea maricola]|uniref:Uncharacterized protein n=1 Tax=Vallitalea maricola TaxID=3074433 RepID=A0ACB5ULP1_9FIRM|nr:hypothetical protein AN2V17_27690 [Vallitalea sp. AN17-2]
MRNFAVEVGELDNQENRLKLIGNQISDIKSQFNQIQNTLDWDIKCRKSIDDNLKNIYRELDRLDDRLYLLGDVIRTSKQAYDQAEKQLTSELLELDDKLASNTSFNTVKPTYSIGYYSSILHNSNIYQLQDILYRDRQNIDQFQNYDGILYGPLGTSNSFINGNVNRYMAYSPSYLYPNRNIAVEALLRKYISWDFSAYESLSTQVGVISTSLDSATDLGIQYIPSIIKNSPRPNNIGIGTWNKIVTNDIDDIVGSMNVMGKGAKILGVAGVGIDVGTNIYNNVKNNTDNQRIVTDAYVDTAIGVGGLLASAKVGALAGTAFTPGIGTAVGFCVGIGFAVVTDVIKINGVSIRDYLKEGIDAITDITVDTLKIVSNAGVDTIGIVINTLSDTTDIISDSVMDTANVINDTVINTAGIVSDAVIETTDTITNAAMDTVATVTCALNDTTEIVNEAITDTVNTVNDTLIETNNIVDNALSDVADVLSTADNVSEALLDSSYIVAQATSDTLDTVNVALTDTIGTINSTLSDTMDTVSIALSDTADIINTAVSDTMDTFTSTVSDTYEIVNEAVSETIDTVEEAVSETIDTVEEAVSDTIDTVTGAVDDIADSITDRIGSWFD